MGLEETRAALVEERRRLDRAVAAVDQALGGQPRSGCRRRSSPEIIQQLTLQRRRRLLVALYEAGMTLESLRQLSGLTKRTVRTVVGAAVDRRQKPLSDDAGWWSRRLDDGASIAELAVAADSSTNRLSRHLRGLGVWPRPVQTFERWLEQRTDVAGDCRIWRQSISDTQTMPMGRWAGRTGVVRRLVWEHVYGPVAAGVYVTATRACPDPVRCVAENHSRVLTPHQASLERSLTGRIPHGEQHGNALLTEDQALTILISPESTRRLADRYGVSQATVHAIKTGRRWKHLRSDEPLA